MKIKSPMLITILSLLGITLILFSFGFQIFNISGSGIQLASIIPNIIAIACLIGYLMMKKLAVYLYTGLFVLSNSYSLIINGTILKFEFLILPMRL